MPGYERILDALNWDGNQTSRLEDLPFIPVSLFKEFELLTDA